MVGFFVSISFRHSWNNASWGSLHCIASIIWYALMLVHIGQHWQLTKSLTKWKVIRRNVITTLTSIVFILMTFSIVLFIFDIEHKSLLIHHIVGRFFGLIIIIHLIAKAKRFVRLFKHKQKEQKQVI